MSAAHPFAGVERLHQIAEGGGQVAVVSGSGGPPYYTGLHRPSANTLLEAVLTFLAVDEYQEIIIFAGRGPHLPDREINATSRLGTYRIGLHVRGPVGETAPNAVPPPAELGRFVRKPRSSEAAVPVELNASNLNWRDRLPEMFDRIEKYCGKDHLGNKLPGSVSPIRRLILIDAEFLIPEPGLWHHDIAPGQAESGQLSSRFARIPEYVNGTKNDVILLARDRQEADSVRTGQLVYRRLDAEARRFQQFGLGWTRAETLVLPSALDESGFREYYPRANVAWPAWQQYRLTVLTNPKTHRVVPLEKLTSDEICRRLGEAIIGQDTALRRIADVITRRVGTRDESDTRPIASILLAGPTGTGKSATAKALAKALYAERQGVFQELKMEQGGKKDMSAQLFGLEPGYVGFTADMGLNGGGRLTRPIIQNPDQPFLFLFDELERAPAETADSLFGALDDGTATDISSGHKVSFRNSIFIFTTNVAADELQQRSDAGVLWESLCEQTPDLLSARGPSSWSKPFLARFRRNILPLCHPAPEALRGIARKHVREAVEKRHRFGKVDPAFLERVCTNYSRELGVRNLQEQIDGILEPKLLELNRTGRTGLHLSVTADGHLYEEPVSQEAAP
jgi:DNA polymerase III delta prime subunit